MCVSLGLKKPGDFTVSESHGYSLVKLNCRWNFRRNWTASLLVLSERSRGSSGIDLVRFGFRMWEILISNWQSAAENSNKFPKNQVLEGKISWGHGNNLGQWHRPHLYLFCIRSPTRGVGGLSNIVKTQMRWVETISIIRFLSPIFGRNQCLDQWEKWLKTRGEKGENYVLYSPPPMNQWASDTLDNAVQKSVLCMLDSFSCIDIWEKFCGLFVISFLDKFFSKSQWIYNHFSQSNNVKFLTTKKGSFSLLHIEKGLHN